MVEMNPRMLVTQTTCPMPDGRRLQVMTAGDMDVTLVIIHGYIDSWLSFGRMLPFLLPDYGAILPDQRGHGATGGTEDGYTVDDFVGDAIALMENMAGKPVHLIGHSLGAIIAHRVASARPDLLKSITLIGGAVSSMGNATLSATYRDLAGLDDPIPYDFAYDFQKGTAFQPLDEAVLRAYVDESMKVKAKVWKEALLGLTEDVHIPGEAPAIPALILWGAHDEIFPLEDQLRLRAWMPDARVINYDDLGHAPQWEDPARVSADIRAFIQSL